MTLPAAVLTLVIPADTETHPSVSVSVNLDSLSLTESLDRAIVWLEAHRGELRGRMKHLAMVARAGLN